MIDYEISDSVKIRSWRSLENEFGVDSWGYLLDVDCSFTADRYPYNAVVATVYTGFEHFHYEDVANGFFLPAKILIGGSSLANDEYPFW